MPINVIRNAEQNICEFRLADGQRTEDFDLHVESLPLCGNAAAANNCCVLHDSTKNLNSSTPAAIGRATLGCFVPPRGGVEWNQGSRVTDLPATDQDWIRKRLARTFSLLGATNRGL